jgi:diacylglycerol kinase (ATP)
MIAGAKRRLYVLILAINPYSGRGHASEQSKKARLYFSSVGISTIEVQGQDLLDFRRKLVEALRTNPITGVVAVGGDGFVHEVIQHVVPRGLSFGVIPCGTGNDFARSLGIYSLSFRQQVELIAQSKPQVIDLGRIDQRWFAAILSTGFDALVNEKANQMRWPKGRMKYNIAMVQKLVSLKANPYRIRMDHEEIEVDATLITVANGSSYGGGMKVCPAASLDDGLFDVMILGRVSRIELLKVFPKVYRGKHVGHPVVTFYRCREVEIRGSGSSFADGEPMAALPLTAECVSAVLKVWAA